MGPEGLYLIRIRGPTRAGREVAAQAYYTMGGVHIEAVQKEELHTRLSLGLKGPPGYI